MGVKNVYSFNSQSNTCMVLQLNIFSIKSIEHIECNVNSTEISQFVVKIVQVRGGERKHRMKSVRHLTHFHSKKIIVLIKCPLATGVGVCNTMVLIVQCPMSTAQCQLYLFPFDKFQAITI